MNTEGGKKRRGFGSMDSAKQREISSKGGKTAHAKGTARKWTPDEACAAGSKGGQASRDKRRRLLETAVTGIPVVVLVVPTINVAE